MKGDYATRAQVGVNLVRSGILTAERAAPGTRVGPPPGRRQAGRPGDRRTPARNRRRRGRCVAGAGGEAERIGEGEWRGGERIGRATRPPPSAPTNGSADPLISARCTSVFSPEIKGDHRSEDGPKLGWDGIAPIHK